MSWFFFMLLLSFIFSSFSEGSHDQKESAVVVGTVYCDTCFQGDFSRTSHFISGASVALECNDGTSRPSFRQEVKTNEHGEFKVHLPFSVSKRVKKINGCSVKLIRSSEPYCAVASTATSSSLHLMSRKQGTHIFSAGFFTFKPLKQPILCNQKPSVQNPKELKNKEPTGDNVDHPESLFSTPSVFPPDDPVPAPAILPPNQFLPPNPFLPPPLFPPNPFQPPPLFPPNPFQPPPLLPPNPFQPPAPLIPNPFQPPPAPLIPNPFQPPPAPIIPNPFQPPPAPLFPPNPFQPPPAPPAPWFRFPPIPGLTPTPSPPPPPAFPFPLPPFHFPPVPPFPGIPPASPSPKKSSP